MQDYSFEWENNHKNEQVYFSPHTSLWNINLHDNVTTKPALYNIILLENENISEDFMTKIIEIFFNKTHKESSEIIREIKRDSQSVCGIFPKDVAETKIRQIRSYCTLHNKHIKCAMERRP